MIPKTLQLLIISLVTLVGACGVYGVFWYMVFLRENESRTHAEERARAQARVQEIQHLTTLVTDTEHDRAVLNQYVVADADVTTFLALVEQTGRDVGLVIETQSVTIENGVDGSLFETLVLSFEVRGGYTKVIRFLELIETMPYQIGVRSVALDRTGEESALDTVWRGVFTISVTKAKAL